MAGVRVVVAVGVCFVTQAQGGMDLEERPVFLIAAVSRLDQHVTHLSSRSS